MSADLQRTAIEFAVLVERMTRLLLATTHGLLSGVSLIQAKNSGEYPKTGRIGDGEYSFHGSGCRFELDSGELVDFDLSVHDEGSFDGFRLQSFVKSRSEEWNDAAASEVLADLVNSGVLVQPKSGWYRLA